MLRTLSIGVVVCALLLVRSLSGADDPTEIDPKAAAAIRAAGEYLQQLKTFRCECATTFKITLGEKTNELAAEYSIALERPNRVALLLKQGEMGASIVSDGKEAYQFVPALKRYTVQAAPETLEQYFKPESTIFFGQGAAMLLPTLLAADPTKALMDGVSGGKHLGEEEIEKTKCHHLRFSQREMDWDIWIETGDRPLIRRLSLDMSKSLARVPQPEAFKNAKMEVVLALKEWQPNAELAADTFRFQPPKDATRVESLTAGLFSRDEPEQHTLLGKPAPEFEARLLDDKKLKLVDLKGKVVILDFWATWCGPCVKALPIITQVAREHEKQGVVLLAVNVGEEADVIREFLKEQKLEIQVVLDPQSKLSEDYGVQGIPQTVLIGKDGKVQAVHVGLSGDLKQRLGKELDALVKGEDLAAKAAVKAEEAKRLENEATGQATLLWSVPGSWAAVAAVGDGAVAVNPRGAGIHVDAAGSKQRDFSISGAHVLRVARLSNDKPALLAYSVWGHSLEAFSLTGEHLWSYGEGQGIDDVWAFDLDGDKADEVIIGYNGSTGLHVLDGRGKLLWKYTEIGNVWHVCAGDVIGDKKPEVVTTSAAGMVHLFDPMGNKLEDIDSGLYATLVRVAQPVGDAKAAMIVGGSVRQGEGSALVRLDGEGNKSWSLPLEGRVSITSAHIASSRPWIAVSQRTSLLVVDMAAEKVIARIDLQGSRPQLAWLERTGQSPLLLVANGKDLNAFVVEEQK
jgi:peroxiredoxin